MKLYHPHIQGRTVEIVPSVEKYFPNHSAVLIERQEGKKEPIFMKMLRSQEEGLRHAAVYGFEVPVGFYYGEA